MANKNKLTQKQLCQNAFPDLEVVETGQDSASDPIGSNAGLPPGVPLQALRAKVAGSDMASLRSKFLGVRHADAATDSDAEELLPTADGPPTTSVYRVRSKNRGADADEPGARTVIVGPTDVEAAQG